jgi:hypothetical protein
MIRVQIDEWLHHDDMFDREPKAEDPNGPRTSPGRMMHSRTLLLQDFEHLEVAPVVAFLNGLVAPPLCRCGHSKEMHTGGCSAWDPGGFGTCDCKEYQPVTVNDFLNLQNELGSVRQDLESVCQDLRTALKAREELRRKLERLEKKGKKK